MINSTSSALGKKSEMYTMIISIEEDFIANFREKLKIVDIPQSIIDSSKFVANEHDEFLAILRGLDIQSYIEICNKNIVNLKITAEQKRFINTELAKLIPIRNAIMHPRPLGFFDYSMVKEVFQNIENSLECFTWTSVKKAKNTIENHPEDLKLPPIYLKKNEKIIENLPSVLDYEETSFVGRNKEIAEIRAMLKRKNVNILSIIGDGGIGKTAITLKLLYDMLDDPECEFEMIVWTSLKTNELSDNTFKEIRDSIKTTSEMYEKLSLFVAENSISDTRSFIIELAQTFNTLFVLDNLETINTADIRDFIDEFSEFGKVLITSRIGLGEMEHRYKLTGLNENDLLAYVDRLLELYGYSCLYTDDRKKEIFINELHSNPLAIKWFIRCLYSGLNEKEILDKKEDVINFCMSNVYDKLSNDAREVLNVMTIAGVELSFPELIYYSEAKPSDSLKIKYAINELGKCNFIDEYTYRKNKSIAVTDFAREFLSLQFSNIKHLLPRFKELKQQLSSMGQQLIINRSENKYTYKTIYYKGNAELVTANYLAKAIDEKDKESALEIIKFAQELMPQYYETHLALAKVHGAVSPLITSREYELALECCSSDEEKIRVYMLYSDFLIRINDYQGAMEKLDKALAYDMDIVEIKFQKSKVYSYMGQYDLAKNILLEIDASELSTRNFNKLQTGFADICRRKSEKIDIRETQARLEELKSAYYYLEECSAPDTFVYDYISKLLEQVSYLYFDKDSLEFVLDVLKKHYKNIKKARHYNDFVENLLAHFPQIDDSILKRELSKYVINFNSYLNLLASDEAVVYNLKQGYGFCKNTQYPSGIYFSMRGVPQSIDYGDILSFSSVLETKGKYSVVCPKIIGKMLDRIDNMN